ncbi:hybrid signal transduction histidine kinase M, partial [Tanacetum coccineum]
AFESLKEKLTCAPVILSPNWNLPFEHMCNASDFAIGAVLVQDQMQKQFKVGVSKMKAFKAKRIASDIMTGSYKEQKGCRGEGGGSSQAGARKVFGQVAGLRKVSGQAAGARNVSGQAASARKASSQPSVAQSLANQGPRQAIAELGYLFDVTTIYRSEPDIFEVMDKTVCSERKWMGRIAAVSENEKHQLLLFFNAWKGIPQAQMGTSRTTKRLFKNCEISVGNNVNFGVLNIIMDTSTNEERATEEWGKLDSLVKLWIFGTISKSLLQRVLKKNVTASQIWKNLKDVFHDNKSARAMQLDNELRTIKLRSLSITEYFHKITASPTS